MPPPAMLRTRNPVTEEEFFASLNDQSDMRAITHGHQRLMDAVDEGVERLLKDRGLTRKDSVVQRLGIDGQVDVLVLANRLDADLRPLIDHLTAIRHRMVHGYGVEFTKAEGATAWRLLPERAKDRSTPRLDPTNPRHVIRGPSSRRTPASGTVPSMGTTPICPSNPTRPCSS